MKAEELMIGDWVDFGSVKRQVIQSDYCQDVNGDCILDGTRPIPITPEILEANGWMYVDEDRMFYGEKLEGELPWITYASHGNKMVFRLRDFCRLNYVHELQHALRLCGIEKDLKLEP